MVLVTGSTGQLGYDIINELNVRNIPNKGLCRKDLDITNKIAIRRCLEKEKPECIIHCAGYTAVDKADSNECEKKICMQVNYEATKNIAEVCKEFDIKLLYVSTDYVFDGNKEGEYETDDYVNPISTYGKSKACGEKAIVDILDKYYIIRTSWLFGLNGKNFVRTIQGLAEKNEQINVISDQIGSPTYTKDLAECICDIISDNKYGIYHVTNEGFCSWAQLAEEVIRLTNIKCNVRHISTIEFNAIAKRPLNSRLSKKKLIKNGFEKLPTWKNALERYLNK